MMPGPAAFKKLTEHSIISDWTLLELTQHMFVYGVYIVGYWDIEIFIFAMYNSAELADLPGAI